MTPNVPSTPVQVSAKHKLVGVPWDGAVRNLFPDAKEIDFSGMRHILVPHGPVETFILRKLGFVAPSPIISHYDWPGTTAPFDVQKKTASLLVSNKRAYVLNDLGTGKTRSLLWAWDYLRSNNMCDKLLVLAPLSTLEFTWLREAFATLPHRKAVVLHGTKAQRLKRLSDPDAEIFILNHDGVGVILNELLARKDIDVLGIDELAVYRNGQSTRTKTAIKLAGSMEWGWGMTGRPIPRAPTDTWAQARILTPHTVPKFFGRYREQLMVRSAHSQFQWFPKADAAERAFDALQPAVRYSIDDVVELPDIIERPVDVALGPKQQQIYKALAAQCYAQVQSQEITAANAAVVMNKLLQVATGWVYAADGSVVALDNDLRIEAMLEAIDGTNNKVLVFVPFKHALAGISAAIQAEGIEHAVVSGDTPAAERASIFNNFQNTGKYKVLAAHPLCLAHGITLTSADTIIWFGPTTSLDVYDQANARIRRIGQKHKQQILKFQGTPVERRIYKILSDHQAVQDRLLELFEYASE